MIEPLPVEAQEELFALLGREWHVAPTTRESAGRIALVGLEGTGKRTLLNNIWKWEVLDPQDRTHPIQNYGLFTLIDLPPDLMKGEPMLAQIKQADAVIYLLGDGANLRREDFGWLTKLRAAGPALVVSMNEGTTNIGGVDSCAEAARRLGLPVLPVRAHDAEMVHREFLPAVIRACPQLDVALAAQIGSLRTRVAWRHILRGVISSVVACLDTPSDEPVTVSHLQINLVGQIAAVYGTRLAPQDEAVGTMIATALELATRYVGQRLHTPTSGHDRLVSAAVSAVATLFLGQVALAMYGDTFTLAEEWLPASRRDH